MMMGRASRDADVRRCPVFYLVLLITVFASILIGAVPSSLFAQGVVFGQRVGPAPRPAGTVGALDLAPSNPLAWPGGTSGQSTLDSIPISSGVFSGLLPRWSNLDFGLLYEFSKVGIRNLRGFGDLVVPFANTPGSTLFAEAHYETTVSPERDLRRVAGRNSVWTWHSVAGTGV